jgi:dipeptidyl aminopeptidase/acylaminoacyl peptidase
MRASLACFVLLCLPVTAVAEPPPISTFTNFPKFESMKISPNGTYLAFTRYTTEHEVITVLRLSDLKPMTQSHFGDRIDISSFTWANDRRLMISPTRRFPGLVAHKVPTGEIIGLDADGKDAELLFGYSAGERRLGTRVEQRQSTYQPATVLSRLPDSPTEILIQTYGYSYEGDFNSVYRMDAGTGFLRKVAGSPIRDGQFRVNLAREVTLVAGSNKDGNHQVFWRPTASADWMMMSDTAMDEGLLWPLGPTAADGEYFALDNRDASTYGVVAWSPATDAKRLLFRDPEVDTGAAAVDPQGRVYAFSYDDHFPRYWYPDPAHPLAEFHQWLTKTFPDHTISITSQTDDLKLAVVQVSAPRTPVIYFVVDVPNRKFLHQLQSRPDLKSAQLAVVEPIEFKARDGLAIRGYLTMPQGAVQKNLPMIVMVHGGPHGPYDEYVFDWETQLFASRGYVVLQINYRGSGGRGRNFEAAGYGKWGREMQDDVTDGVRWAIADGVADGKRICIYGGSYGAYSALTGAFREPDLFRCAVGMAGIYDLPLMFEKGDIQTARAGLKYLRLAVGTDEEELRRRSPVYNADKIKVPVLLLHGKIDERAPYEHAKRMRDALEKAGNPPEWSTEWGEGHGFFDETNRGAAYTLMLEFFGKHLGAPASGT